jgi:hypothetical protein
MLHGASALVEIAAGATGSEEFAGGVAAVSLLAVIWVLSGGLSSSGSTAAATGAPRAPSSDSRTPRSETAGGWQACLPAAEPFARVLSYIRVAWPTGPRSSMEYAPVPPPP